MNNNVQLLLSKNDNLYLYEDISKKIKEKQESIQDANSPSNKNNIDLLNRLSQGCLSIALDVIQELNNRLSKINNKIKHINASAKQILNPSNKKQCKQINIFIRDINERIDSISNPLEQCKQYIDAYVKKNTDNNTECKKDEIITLDENVPKLLLFSVRTVQLVEEKLFSILFPEQPSSSSSQFYEKIIETIEKNKKEFDSSIPTFEDKEKQSTSVIKNALDFIKKYEHTKELLDAKLNEISKELSQKTENYNNNKSSSLEIAEKMLSDASAYKNNLEKELTKTNAELENTKQYSEKCLLDLEQLNKKGVDTHEYMKEVMKIIPDQDRLLPPPNLFENIVELMENLEEKVSFLSIFI